MTFGWPSVTRPVAEAGPLNPSSTRQRARWRWMQSLPSWVKPMASGAVAQAYNRHEGLTTRRDDQGSAHFDLPRGEPGAVGVVRVTNRPAVRIALVQEPVQVVVAVVRRRAVRLCHAQPVARLVEHVRERLEHAPAPVRPDLGVAHHHRTGRSLYTYITACDQGAASTHLPRREVRHQRPPLAK